MTPLLWARLKRDADASYKAADAYDNDARRATDPKAKGDAFAAAARRRREAVLAACLLELRDAFEAPIVTIGTLEAPARLPTMADVAKPPRKMDTVHGAALTKLAQRLEEMKRTEGVK